MIDLDRLVERAILGEFRPTPPMKHRRARPNHLFLIHRRAEGDHLASLFESLVRHSLDMGVQAEAYTFGSEPTMFFRPQRSSSFMTLDDLGRMHTNDRLLVVGESSLFFDRLSGQLHTWASLFWNWRERAILTPTPQAAWGHHDAVLASEGFLVAPATSTGIDAISREWVSNQELESDRAPTSTAGGVAHVAPPFPPLLAPEVIHLVSGSRPHRAHLKELREQLTAYLDSGIEWLSACAVYPQLHWNLTLRVGSALFHHGLIPEVTLDRMALLASLPWFRDGRMPDAVRSHLLTTLKPADRKGIQRVVAQILFAQPPRRDVSGMSAIEIEMRRPGIVERLFSLFRRDW